MTQLYDKIGKDYRGVRRPDPYWTSQIASRLPSKGLVLNVGAGTGSYEPDSRRTVAVEPSFTMIKQRSPYAAPVVQAVAEALPFEDHTFSLALSVLSSHHWPSRTRAFEEIGRVASRKAVFVTWDPDHEGFWLTQDYFPEILEIDRGIFPRLSEFSHGFGSIEVHPLLVSSDCADGFLGAYWRRPAAYLDDAIRAGMSTFSKIDAVEAGLTRLRTDLESGNWKRKYGHTFTDELADLGYRIVVAEIQ